MPQRRQRRAPPSSRLTTAGRVAIAAVLAGMVLLRTGWGRLGRDGDGPWPPWQRIAAPGGATPGPTRDALAAATATTQGEAAGTRSVAATATAAAGPGEPAARAAGSATPIVDGDPTPRGGTPPQGVAWPGPDDRPLAAVVVGGVVAEAWLRRDASLGLDVPTVTLRTPGRPAHALAWARLDPQAGRDVTGDGRPDLVLERDTGGMGCCWALWAYEAAGGGAGAGGAPADGRDADAGAEAWLSEAAADGLGLRPVLGLPLSRCRGRFEDLDGDGALEVVTCDPTVPAELCSAYDGGDPTVVLRYEDGGGFVPATADVAATAAGRARLDAADGVDDIAAGAGGGDGLCDHLPAALADLYRGRDDNAWSRLAGLDDAAAVRRRITALVSDSPLYRPPGAAGRPVIGDGGG